MVNTPETFFIMINNLPQMRLRIFKKKKKKKTNSEIVQNEYDHEKPKERLYLQKKDRKLLKI